MFQFSTQQDFNNAFSLVCDVCSSAAKTKLLIPWASNAPYVCQTLSPKRRSSLWRTLFLCPTLSRHQTKNPTTGTARRMIIQTKKWKGSKNIPSLLFVPAACLYTCSNAKFCVSAWAARKATSALTRRTLEFSFGGWVQIACFVRVRHFGEASFQDWWVLSPYHCSVFLEVCGGIVNDFLPVWRNDQWRWHQIRILKFKIWNG